MQVNHNFSFWQKFRPKSYLASAEIPKDTHHFEMGENIMIKNAIPYPDPVQIQLKKALAKIFRVNPEMISLGCGSDEIIENIPKIFLDPGDDALVILPTFFRFLDATLRVGARIISISTNKEEGFSFSKTVIENAIRIAKQNKAKLIWLCSPNNPTGVTLTASQLERFASLGNLVVLDEAFVDLTANEQQMLKLLSKHQNLIILRSFSKLAGLAGLRLGCAISSPEIINLLEQWRLPFNLPTPTVKLILAKLRTLEFEIGKAKKQIDIERSRLFNEISKLKNVELGSKSETNIFILRHKTKDLFNELLKNSILVADFRQAPGLTNLGFVRLTLKTPRENRKLLEVLKKID